MSTLGRVLLMAPGFAPATQDVHPTTSEVLWPLGLRVVQVAEVSRANRFGRRGGWIGNDENALFEVRPDGETLAIEIQVSTEGGYAHHSLNLWLSSTTALATAGAGSCTWVWYDQNLAGTVCIVTDGDVAAAEFEVYDGARAEYGEAYFGYVDLGSAGAGLAKAARPAGRAPLRLVRQHHRGQEIFGHVDPAGRRQGLWFVRDEARSTPVLEMSWRDGIPDGAYRVFGNQWVELSSGAFRLGFQDGEAIEWRRTGERIVSRWDDGLQAGEVFIYRPDGDRCERPRLTSVTGPDPVRWKQFRSELATFRARE